MVSTLDKRTNARLVIERLPVRDLSGTIKKCAFPCYFWQVALHHVATVHPAVNGYLKYRTETEVVRTISDQRVQWQRCCKLHKELK